MRIALNNNYIEEVNHISTNGYFIFVNGTTYIMKNENEGYELYNQMLRDGYIDLSNYERGD
jgi:hypothetical protein